MDAFAQDHLQHVVTELEEQLGHLREGVAADYVKALPLLQLTGQLDRELNGLRASLVALARAEGRSWSAVGDALGTTRQAVWERYSIAP